MTRIAPSCLLKKPAFNMALNVLLIMLLNM